MHLKNATGVHTSKFAEKVDLKSDVDILKNARNNLNNLKSKVDILDVNKLVPVSCQLSDVVKNDVVKRDVYSAKIKNIEDEISDLANLTTNTTVNAKINEVKNGIPTITNLATTTAINAKINGINNKIPNITKLAVTAIENKIPTLSNLLKKKTDHSKKLIKMKIPLIC